MKRFYTQAGIVWSIRFIAMIGVVFATILAIIFEEPSLLLLYIFSLMLYLMSFIGYIFRITFDGNFIVVKAPAVGGTFSKMI